MADADELLREAQYAYQCISFGDTRENRRNAARAASLANKIVRKYPTSIEAPQARELLARLQAEPHSPKPSIQHTHTTPDRPHEHVGRQSSLENLDGEVPGWQKLWSGFVRLRITYQLIALVAALLFLAIYGFVAVIVGALIVYFRRPLKKHIPPRTRQSLIRLMQQLDAWLTANRT